MKQTYDYAVSNIFRKLVRLTTVPREKSVVQWKLTRIFSSCSFETEYKGKVYVFDGRRLYVYPAGHDLPPYIRIGDRKGPDILVDVDCRLFRALSDKLFRAARAQYTKELDEDDNLRARTIAEAKEWQKRQLKRQKLNAQKILRDLS